MAAIPPEIKAFFAEIRRRRLALGLSLGQFSARAGLTPNYIGAIEIGKRDPSVSTVFHLAIGLETEPGELFGGQGEHGEVSAAALEVARLFDLLPPEIQPPVTHLFNALVRRRA